MKPISWYKSLSRPKPRREEGCFLVDGKRSVDHLLTHRRESVLELLCVEEAAQSYQSYQSRQSSDIPIRIISEANMDSISPSRTPQGVCALVRMPDNVYTSKIPEASINGISVNCNNSIDNNGGIGINNTCIDNAGINTGGGIRINTGNTGSGIILLLEHIQDPGNIGTLIRTAAAFGVDGVIMSGQCADPFSPKAVQSTAGSLLSLWLRRSNDYLLMVTELKKRGYKLTAADLRGDVLRCQEQERVGPVILALGSEGSGLSEDVIGLSDYRMRIPIAASGAESLNVAVAGGIFMFVRRR